MIKPVTMYSVVCERCGKQFVDEFNGIVAWLEKFTHSILKDMKSLESNISQLVDEHFWDLV